MWRDETSRRARRAAMNPSNPPALTSLRLRSIRVAATLLALHLQVCAADQPNVLIFFIDDLGRTDLAVDGSPFHETPRLDALARAGVRFTDFYSAHPVCSPTRGALMTGKAPQRVGITDWIHPQSGIAIPPTETTLGEAFQTHGYQTAYVGKWHLGEADADHPTRHGFAWTLGVNRAGQPASYHFPYRRAEGTPTVWDVPDLADGQPGDYLTDVLTTKTIRFLKQRDRQRPFLLSSSSSPACPHPRRRSRLGRTGLLRPAEDPDAEHRPPRRAGMRFTQHYSGAPVCAPSRCVLMTGKHLGDTPKCAAISRPRRFPEFTEGQYPLSEQRVTIAQVFQRAGYATGAMGKWGLGPVGSTGDPNRKGFDLFFGYNCQASRTASIRRTCGGTPRRSRSTPSRSPATPNSPKAR
jgi:arylsulfatase A-like enzyme